MFKYNNEEKLKDVCLQRLYYEQRFLSVTIEWISRGHTATNYTTQTKKQVIKNYGDISIMSLISCNSVIL